jgi:hypothetical protein
VNASLLTSSKLHDLLTQLWSSPVFGTSYPFTFNGAHATVLRTIDQIYHQTLATLDHVLGLAWPDVCAAERDVVIRQVAAKSVAFCGAIAVDHLQNVEQLRAAASAIALVSWIDQTMDRGDEAMVTAVELVSGTRRLESSVQSAAVQHYVAALSWFRREVAVIAAPEDAPIVLRCLIDDTLAPEARMWRLSKQYQHMNPDCFWQRFAGAIGQLTVHNVGLVAVTAMVYAIYRRQHPQLPCLREIIHDQALMHGPVRAGEATIRMLDDIGDQTIDAGGDQAWGIFAINLWNQDDPRYLTAFLDAAGIAPSAIRTAMDTAYAMQDESELTLLWLDYVRSAYAAILPEQRTRYETFLLLSQRVIEAGLVNALGDDVLAEEPRGRAIGA